MKPILITFLLFFSFSVYAEYNSNATGHIKWIKLYNDGQIYFEIADQQPTHTQYNKFAIRNDDVVSNETRSKYYSTLLTAKSSGSKVSVGYDNTANCSYKGAVEVYAIELAQ